MLLLLYNAGPAGDIPALSARRTTFAESVLLNATRYGTQVPSGGTVESGGWLTSSESFPMKLRDGAEPLLYWHGAYRLLSNLDRVLTRA